MAKSKTDGKVTQKQMVRDALGEKGWQVPPLELQEYIKDKYEVELATNVISNYKSVIKKEDGTSGTSNISVAVGAKLGRKAAVGLDMADLEAVKGLVSRLGAEQVKKLAAMFE